MTNSKKRVGAQGRTRPPRERQVMATTLKWVGGLTAVLTLIFGLHQLTELISVNRERHRQVEELMAIAKTQEQTGDRDGAWTSLEKAAQVAKGDTKVEAAQADVAMRWLRTRYGPDEKRFDASKFLPVLDQAASTTRGQRKADILAHIGWAELLRSDDDAFERQGYAYLREALQIDAQNVYAHAMAGYWALRSVSGPRGGSGETETERKVGVARKEFSLALGAGREQDYVRELQIAGFRALETPGGDVELIELVDAMRKNGQQISWRTRNEIIKFYADRLTPSIVSGTDYSQPTLVYSEARRRLLGTLPPADQLATFTWVWDVSDLDPSKIWLREYYRAVLQEADGQYAQARQSLLTAQSNMPDDYETGLMIKDAVRRLSKEKPQH